MLPYYAVYNVSKGIRDVLTHELTQFEFIN